MKCANCGAEGALYKTKIISNYGGDSDKILCGTCFDKNQAKELGFINNALNPLATANSQVPILSIIFYVLALVGLLGGIILCINLWPGEPDYGYGWKVAAYIPAITWLTVGVVQAALFAAIGQTLIYLQGIFNNTKQPEKKEKEQKDLEKV